MKHRFHVKGNPITVSHFYAELTDNILAGQSVTLISPRNGSIAVRTVWRVIEWNGNVRFIDLR
ncbi:hypothetical protein [Pedobacter namyangjuensis]|uniref:hypothetical protein n=1 Tax=Pedobacter namyangjuensis TaxID=600626 RepID=UPI0013B3F630|nr:hypothetical protein [Pedobacter namyangjuensis]